MPQMNGLQNINGPMASQAETSVHTEAEVDEVLGTVVNKSKINNFDGELEL